MRFTKMHGLGNDYLYIFGEVPSNVAELAVKLSDRHFGVGSDGLIYICRSETADYKMRIFNADGSEAKMCGNGIRCVGKYLYDKGYVDRTRLTIETLSGIKTLTLHTSGGKARAVAVDMGVVTWADDIIVDAGGRKVVCKPVSVGNPHAVVFVNNAERAPLTSLGPQLERNKAFPGGVNVEFAQAVDETTLRARVWERGSGVTLACGTGACACAAAAVHEGFCGFNVPISVELDGGSLTVQIAKDRTATMTGPAEIVYEGEIAL